MESIRTSTLCMPIYSEYGEEVPATFTYNGEVITGSDYIATGTAPPEISYTATLFLTDSDSPPNTASDTHERAPASLYTGHTQMAVLLLVQGGDDSSDNDGGDGDGGDEGDGDGNGDDENAGSSSRAGLGASLVTLAAVWGVAGIIGAALMAPRY